MKRLRWFLCPLFVIAGITGIYFGFNFVLVQMCLEKAGEVFSKSQVIFGTLLIFIGFYAFLLGAVVIPDKTFDD